MKLDINTLYVHVFMVPHMCVVRGGHVTIIQNGKVTKAVQMADIEPLNLLAPNGSAISIFF